MTLNPEQLRDETLGLESRIHLDHAGASLMPRPVYEVMSDHLRREANLGGYVAQDRARRQVEATYQSVARLIGANAHEIAVTASAADGWDRAFYSIPLARGDIIVTAFNEYCANYVAYLHRQRRDGIKIRVIGPDSRGCVDPKAVANAIDEKVKLITLSHVPATSGQINPTGQIGRIAREAGIPYLLDACQSVGQIPIDVRQIGCDILTGTARKFLRGPRATGFLFVRSDMLKQMQPAIATNAGASWTGTEEITWRDDARLFENWERNVAGMLGLNAAAEYALELGLEAISRRAHALAAQVRSGLQQIAGIEVLDRGPVLSAIVTFRHRRITADTIKQRLEEKGIAVGVSSVFYTRLDLEARGIDTAVRLSPHYITLDYEIDRFLLALDEVLQLR